MDKEFVKELFAPFGDVTIKPMFGEIGIFYRGLSFAGIMGGELRLKCDQHNKPEFEAEDMQPWKYTYKSGKVVIVDYWQVPESLMDDPDAFKSWAQKAFEAAMRADAAKPLKHRKLEQL